ncbi:MAG: hypothetical protein DI537_15085 [Stutzerimonas stutzeri]|nr:MAG: hypothetical protein DI537_15085 [Stutzerimonas stutzeri]
MSALRGVGGAYRLIILLILLCFAAPFSWFAASFTGLIAALIISPMIVLAVFIDAKLLLFVPLLLAAPTSLLVLPVVGLCVPHDGWRGLALTLSGAASGAVTIVLIESFVVTVPPTNGHPLLVIGTIAGTVGGIVFAAALGDAG